MKKIPRRFAPYVFAFYMALFMALLMCGFLVWLQTGFDDGYWLRALKAYLVAMPVAFCCVVLLRPIVVRFVEGTVE